MKPAPRDFIESYIGGSDYWANGIRKQYKGVNEDQIAFCNNFKKMLQDLMVYVKEHHTTGSELFTYYYILFYVCFLIKGVAWNPRGVDINEFSGASSSSTPSKKEEPKKATTTATSSSSGSDRAGLFASLSKGGEITSGLKTVTKDQQTWRKEFNAKDAKPVAVKKAPVPRAAEKVLLVYSSCKQNYVKVIILTC